MEVVLVMWIFQQAFLYKGPPKLSGPKYTDHTHYSLEKYSFYPWIIFLGTNPRWSFNLISLAAERKNSIIIFLFWNHIFWTNLNKYAIVARRKEKNYGKNSHAYVIEWIHDYLKTIRNHLPSELASPHLGNNQNLINWLNPERWFEKLWPLLISAENPVNFLSESDFFTSSSVRKRRGEEIEADVRRAIAERKRACMWKGSLLRKQYIQNDVLAAPTLPSC